MSERPDVVGEGNTFAFCMYFFLFDVTSSEMSLGFELLTRQNKQFEDVGVGSEKLCSAFLTHS